MCHLSNPKIINLPIHIPPSSSHKIIPVVVLSKPLLPDLHQFILTSLWTSEQKTVHLLGIKPEFDQDSKNNQVLSFPWAAWEYCQIMEYPYFKRQF